MARLLHAVSTDKAPAAIGPYSQAVVSGGFVFCSGQIALNGAGQLAGTTAADQTGQVMANLLAVLKGAGCGPGDIVKTTIFLKDINDFAAVNDVYAQALGSHRPARATVEVARLPRDALVEIDCIARAPQ